MGGRAKRCGVVLHPQSVVEQVNIQAGAILLPGVVKDERRILPAVKYHQGFYKFTYVIRQVST